MVVPCSDLANETVAAVSVVAIFAEEQAISSASARKADADVVVSAVRSTLTVVRSDETRQRVWDEMVATQPPSLLEVVHARLVDGAT